MIKCFKREESANNNYEIKLINFENGDFTQYFQDKNLGFIYSTHKTNIKNMGYKSIKECIKTLKQRGFLGQEINLEEQKKSEKIGYINLGIERIKRAGRINTNDFKDVVEKLKNYGLGYVDAQNVIIEAHLHSI